MPESRIDVEALVAALNAKREASGLSWRGLAGEAKVSPSSLTRLQQGKRPDVDTFVSLLNWLEMEPSDFLPVGNARPRPHALAVASTLLRGKKEMTPKALQALDDLVQAAYKLSKELK